MSWLYEKHTYPSTKNGEVTALRIFGQWAVLADGLYETTPFLLGLWRSLLRQIPVETKAQRILLLGLAGGGVVPLSHKRFPGCEITAVEWDPAMLKAFDETRICPPDLRPRILIGDAADIVPTFDGPFDLIVLDMFTGSDIPDHVRTPDFFQALSRILAEDGMVLTNAYRYPEVIRDLGAFFRQGGTRRIASNHFAWLYPATSRKGLPVGYTHFRSTPRVIDCTAQEVLAGKAWRVGAEGAWGIGWKAGALNLEKYIGDQEPVLKPVRGPRMVLWQPLTRGGIAPKGWHHFIQGPFNRREGVVELDRTIPERDWDSHALRHLKRWHKQDVWQIAPAPLEEFLDAYARSGQSSSLIEAFSNTMRGLAKGCGDDLVLYAARRGPDAPIESGFATLYVPEIGLAHHVTSFIQDSARSEPVGVGLIEAWFTGCRERGIRLADFGGFWHPGDPASWKGWSRFKSQFGVTYIDFPRTLARFTWE